jgi:DtxR family Mn-dependent transcriptional regulator
VSKRHSASIEDYLEAIMLAAEEGKNPTVTQISQLLGVKKPSVTSALSRLAEMGLVVHEKYGEVFLTDRGRKVARDVYRRHQALRRFLVEILYLDEKIAAEDACRMEHYLSTASMERLDKFIEFVMDCPQGKPMWLEGFSYYITHGKRDPEQIAACNYRSNLHKQLRERS